MMTRDVEITSSSLAGGKMILKQCDRYLHPSSAADVEITPDADGIYRASLDVTGDLGYWKVDNLPGSVYFSVYEGNEVQVLDLVLKWKDRMSLFSFSESGGREASENAACVLLNFMRGTPAVSMEERAVLCGLMSETKIEDSRICLLDKEMTEVLDGM